MQGFHSLQSQTNGNTLDFAQSHSDLDTIQSVHGHKLGGGFLFCFLKSAFTQSSMFVFSSFPSHEHITNTHTHLFDCAHAHQLDVPLHVALPESVVLTSYRMKHGPCLTMFKSVLMSTFECNLAEMSLNLGRSACYYCNSLVVKCYFQKIV